jgi:alkylated DNA repair dioxygenase AlkB
MLSALPEKAKVHIDTGRARLWTVDTWLSAPKAEALFRASLKLHLTRNPEVLVWGQRRKLNRSVGFFSDVAMGYTYSGQVTEAQPLTPELHGIMDDVNAALGKDFNGLLVNLYSDGNDSIGAHSDSPDGLADDGSVVSLSLGAERTFRARHKSKHARPVDVLTKHGQMLVMEGAFQQQFTHEIPMTKRICGPRVSITFRKHRVVRVGPLGPLGPLETREDGQEAKC